MRESLVKAPSPQAGNTLIKVLEKPPTPSVPGKDEGIGILFLLRVPRVAKVLVLGDQQLVDPMLMRFVLGRMITGSRVLGKCRGIWA